MIQSLQQLWNYFSPFQPQLVAFALTLLGSALIYFLRPGVRIIWGLASNNFHKVPVGEGKFVSVYGEKIYVQNVGRKPAVNVDVLLECEPTALIIYPPRHFEQKKIEGGQLLITIPYITKRELIIIDTIHVDSRTAKILSVGCPEATGKLVNFWIQRRLSKFVLVMVFGILIVGIFYALSILVKTTIYVVSGLQQ